MPVTMQSFSRSKQWYALIGAVALTLCCAVPAHAVSFGPINAIKHKVQQLAERIDSRKNNPVAGFGAQLKPVATKRVNGSIVLPAGSPIAASSLTVVSCVGQTGIDTSNNFTLNVLNEGKSQLVFIRDQGGNTIMPAYIENDAVANNSLQITSTQAALGLIVLNPLFFRYSESDKRQILQLAKQEPLFSQLVGEIESALIHEPQNAMNQAIFPGVFRDSVLIGINALKQYGANNPQARRAPVVRPHGANIRPQTATSCTIGTDGNPCLADVSGPDIYFVNPKMNFYGMTVNQTGMGEKYRGLIEGKDGVLSLCWTGVCLTDPVTKEYNLGADGRYGITFYKGFNYSEPDWLSFHTGQGQATWANFLKLFCMIVDDIASCPLNDGEIEGLIAFADKPDFPNLSALSADITNTIVQDIKDDVSPESLLSDAVGVVKDNWDSIALWVWEEWPGVQTVDFLDCAGQIVGGLANAFDGLEVLKDIGPVANTQIPFLWDMVLAPPKLEYDVQVANGVLSVATQQVPPAAAISVSLSTPVVGQAVTFDASNSSDSQYPVNSLQVQWDFTGTNTFTAWSTNKTASHAYSNEGPYLAKLQVKNTDGVIGSAQVHIYVDHNQTAQGTSKHIKLFRDGLPWNSNAFEDMMASLNFSPGTGSAQYEILDSAQMAINIMSPTNDLVIISNDQAQLFYDKLAQSNGRFTRFISNGGTVLWEACDKGWANGSMQMAGLTLPANVAYSFDYDLSNNIVDQNATLTHGMPSQITGYYSSHEEFQNLPAGTKVYATSVKTGLPTLVEFHLDSGWVILTGNPLEWGYDRLSQYTMGQLYPRIIQYVLGLPVTGPGLAAKAKSMARAKSAARAKTASPAIFRSSKGSR